MSPRNFIFGSKRDFDLVFVHIQSGMIENVIHLHENEDHVQYRIHTHQDVPFCASSWHFKERKKLKASVDQGSKAKRNSPNSAK